MSWKPELDEVARRKEMAAKMGGEERVARHVAAGRLPVRERVQRLLDEGSFRESGSLASKVVYDEDRNIELFPPSKPVSTGAASLRPVP